MKKYLIITLFVLLGLAGCEKEKETEKQSNCPTIKDKTQKLVVANGTGNYYYYYFILSDGQELFVQPQVWNQWAVGAEYTPQCVKN